MDQIKRTYTIPESTVASFEKAVPSGRRSKLISQLIERWLAARRRDKLRADIEVGCREMADIYLDVEAQYHPLEEEVERGLETPAKARRRRARPA